MNPLLESPTHRTSPHNLDVPHPKHLPLALARRIQPRPARRLIDPVHVAHEPTALAMRPLLQRHVPHLVAAVLEVQKITQVHVAPHHHVPRHPPARRELQVRHRVLLRRRQRLAVRRRPRRERVRPRVPPARRRRPRRRPPDRDAEVHHAAAVQVRADDEAALLAADQRRRAARRRAAARLLARPAGPDGDVDVGLADRRLEELRGEVGAGVVVAQPLEHDHALAEAVHGRLARLVVAGLDVEQVDDDGGEEDRDAGRGEVFLEVQRVQVLADARDLAGRFADLLAR